MFMPRNLHQRDLAPSFTREARMAYKVDVIGTGKAAFEKTAATASVAQKVGSWLVTPTTWKQWIYKIPFYVPYYTAALPFRGAKFLGVKGFEITRNQVTPYVDPAMKFGKVGFYAPKAGYHLGAGPFVEAFKSWFLLLAKRGILDNVKTGAAGLYNVPAAALSQGREAIINTARMLPLDIPIGVGKGVKNLFWDAPRALLSGEVRKAAMLALMDMPINMASGFVKAPYSIAKIPARVAGEAALMATSYGINIGNVLATPVESVVNGYRQMGKGFEVIDKIQETFGIGKAKALRERFKNVFANRTPLFQFGSPEPMAAAA